jgi:intracellular septation protein A
VIPMLILLLLLVLLFGGLGLFVAKVFFIALAVTVVVGLLAGGSGKFRRS